MNASTAISLSDSAQFLSFFVLLVIGFVYLVGSFALSEIGDLFGGDAPDGTDVDVDGHDTVSVFSPMVVAIFLVGFGGAGAIATSYGQTAMASSLWSLAAGLLLGVPCYFAVKALRSQQSSSEVNPSLALNKVGIVDVEIPPQGTGEVSLTVAGQYMTYMANSAGNAPVRKGQLVKVTRVNGSVLTVQPV